MTDLLKIYRDSNVLYEGNIMQTLKINNQPARESKIQVKLNSSQSGTIYLRGSTVETLTFSSNQFKRSKSLFTSLAGVTPSGLSGNMTITAWNEQNEPVNNSLFVDTGFGSFESKTGKEVLRNYGMDYEYSGILYCQEGLNIQIDDRVIINDDGKTYRVKEKLTLNNPGVNTFFECIIQEV